MGMRQQVRLLILTSHVTVSVGWIGAVVVFLALATLGLTSWVVFKLVITAFATVVLLIYMQTFRQMAALAADPETPLHVVRNPSPVVHSVLALIILLIATVLAVYKPQALTPYGRRTLRQ